MKQAFRIISRMKGYTALSLLGLIISLSGTVIISRYLYQEWTIDHFMPNLNRTYILAEHYQNEPLDEWSFALSYDPNNEGCFVSPVEGQSELEAYCPMALRKDFPISQPGQEVFFPAAVTVADSSFFHIYPVDIVEGAHQLDAPGQCMVSEELAQRLFPGESAVGKTVNIENNTPHTILAVYRQPATKSTLRFDIVQFNTKEALLISNALNVCLVLLREGADVDAYNQRQPFQELTMSGRRPIRFFLQPYSTMSSNLNWTAYQPDNYKCVHLKTPSSQLWMLLFVAVLLLGVGLFNFANLSAVMRSHRRHELHVRRLFGASRWDVFAQLYAETFLVAVLTMIGVWTVVELAEPLLATYYRIEVLPQWKFDVGLTLGIIFGLPLIASCIPARREASAKGLFNLPSLGEGLGGGFQFFISLALLNVSLYFMRQLNVMLTTDPGFRTKGLLSVMVQPSGNKESFYDEEFDEYYANMKKQSDIIQQRLSACPHIKRYCYDPGFIGENPEQEINGQYNVCANWISPKSMELFGIQLKEGRMFNDSTDTFAQYHCLVNETFIRQLGVKDFRDFKVQFKQRMWFSGTADMYDNPPYDIVGVVKDFHPGRQSEPLMPSVYFYEQSMYEGSSVQFEGQYLLMDIAEGHEQEVVDYLRDMVHELFGTDELKYQWVEDQRQALYKDDQRTARIFVTFSLLAIAVTCLGVLGLMMFDVRRRFREIALRKVNGATFRDIALLLSRRYLMVFAVAAVASLPVSLLIVHRLMASYTIRTSFAWWIPLLSIAFILALCALTLWYQVWKATRIKPYKVLKEN
ncbi:MAG: ABC transporter permease [Prevotella sp.]|nr:ABC transporter permease [Prevotella sp.]